MIGLDSVVGRYPEGVMLNQSELGHGSMLRRTSPAYLGPDFSIGAQATIGVTTKLN
jgi:hypothetical protein